MVLWTRESVLAETNSGRFKTFETVPTETLAAAATSRTLTLIGSESAVEN
jgi:hypothetical protein